MYRGGGSIAITASARVVLAVGRNPHKPDELVLAVTKNNLCKVPKSITCAIEPVTADGCDVSRVVWGPESDLTADDIVTRPTDNKGAESRAKAEEFLLRELEGGPRSADELEAEAEKAGITKPTLLRARKQLGMKSEKQGFAGKWRWRLAEDFTPQDTGEVRSSGEIFGGKAEKREDFTPRSPGSR